MSYFFYVFQDRFDVTWSGYIEGDWERLLKEELYIKAKLIGTWYRNTSPEKIWIPTKFSNLPAHVKAAALLYGE